MTEWLLEFCLKHSFSDSAFVTFGVGKALALAAFTWWFCGFSMWLWNRKFKMRLLNHFFCAIASLITLFSILAIQSVGTFKDAANAAVAAWLDAYAADESYHNETFDMTYDELQKLYGDRGWTWDYTNFPDPRNAVNPGHSLPLAPEHPEVLDMILESYRDRAVNHLKTREPLLSKIVWQDKQIPLAPLKQDVDDFFNNHPNGAAYAFDSGTIRLTKELAQQVLDEQVTNVVPRLRLELFGLFLLAQTVAFSLAAYCAYADLKTSRRKT